jgi:hypothetical protein
MIKYQKTKDFIDQVPKAINDHQNTFRFLLTSEPIREHGTNLLLKDDKAKKYVDDDLTHVGISIIQNGEKAYGSLLFIK